jgi:AbrB family looped-hinge helix DNA binding protein
MNDQIMRVSAKGQLTIPISIRKRINIQEGDYIQFTMGDNEVRLRKVEPVLPLSAEDPIWKMVGVAESGVPDVSVNHDRYLAEGECKRWKE